MTEAERQTVEVDKRNLRIVLALTIVLAVLVTAEMAVMAL